MHLTVITLKLCSILICTFLCSTNESIYLSKLNIGDIFSGPWVTENLVKFYNANNSESQESKAFSIEIQTSDMNSVLSTMNFHRSKMNEFFISSFFADLIKNERAHKNDFGKRLGTIDKKSSSAFHNQHVLDSEGSANYISWLQRTATLEDILKRINKSPKEEKNVRREIQNVSVDFDDGDITGYAYNIDRFNKHEPSVHLLGQLGKSQWRYMKDQIPKHQPVEKHGSADNYDGEESSIHPISYSATDPVKSNKEISIKDITEIALTTLAFLSFGMFTLQVLICITTNKDDINNLGMMPMEATDETDISNEGVEEIRRRKRSLPAVKNLETMNEMSRRILFSIDSLIKLQDNQNASCYFLSICTANEFNTNQRILKKHWLPLWSLGTTWMATQILKNRKDFQKYDFIAKSLKLIFFGLNKVNCPSNLANNCRK